MATLCNCGKSRPVRFVDQVTGRGYCNTCACSEITSSRNVHLQFLDAIIPFEKGDRAECWTMGEFYDGFGTVVEVSTELIHGGTPVHPAYLVQLDNQPDPLWYTQVCLRRTRSEASA